MMKVQIDTQYLLQLAREDKMSVLEIIDDFANMTAESLNHLEAMVMPKIQLSAISKILHQLKGSSSSLGMVSLARIFAEMEQWKQSQWENSGYNHKELIRHLEESILLSKEALT